MNTSSDRHAAQVFVENSIGCDNALDFSKERAKFEALELGRQSASSFQSKLIEDADNLLRKAALTMSQSLSAIENGFFAWGFVKLYYFCFFAMRWRLATDGVGVVNCKGTTYTLRSEVGAKPRRHNAQRFRGDHKAVASLYVDQYQDNDLLLSQEIQGLLAPEWLFGQRNLIQYQKNKFIEDCEGEALTSHSGSLSEQVDEYLNDDIPIFCFLPEHAKLAFPLQMIRRSLDTRAFEGQFNRTIQDFPVLNGDAARALVNAI